MNLTRFLTFICFVIAATVILLQSASAQTSAKLKPLLAVPDQVVLHQDFAQPAELDKTQWTARQGTQWSIASGVLRGTPSTSQFQASHKDHKGFEARINAPITPPQFIAEFSVRFVDGKETAIVPFVEFGHHVARLKFSTSGLSLLAAGETLKVAEVADFSYEPGKWYHVLAEMKGDELVVQIADGPTIYAKQPGFAQAAQTGGAGLGIAGPSGGTVEIDDVTIWTVKADAQPDWPSTRETLPKFTPVEISKKGAKPKAAK
jgi:hypothetical protein